MFKACYQMNEAIVPGSLQLWETDSRESYWQQIVLNGEKKEKKKEKETDCAECTTYASIVLALQ